MSGANFPGKTSPLTLEFSCCARMAGNSAGHTDTCTVKA